MQFVKKVVPFIAGLAVLTGIAPIAAAANDAAATIRANTAAWVKAYNAGNADAIVPLYAEDAVVMPPGAASLRGHAAIKEFLVKDIAGAKAAGVASSSPERTTSASRAISPGTPARSR